MRRFTRNDFLAVPPEFHGPGTHGVQSHPGFHTAEQPETTYAYAQVKVVPDDLDEELAELGPAGVRLDDYPVVVTLDMQGLESHVDYDAVKTVKPQIVDLARELVRAAPEDMLDELQGYAEYGTIESDTPDSVVGWLFAVGSPVMQDPSGALLGVAEEQANPERFIRDLAAEKVSDEALAEITGQYRYVDDVSASRILTIDYLAPWFPRIFDWEMEDSDGELAEQLEKAGWAVVGVSDIYDFDVSPRGLLPQAFKERPHRVPRHQLPEPSRSGPRAWTPETAPSDGMMGH
jgi:hypothetical protein